MLLSRAPLLWSFIYDIGYLWIFAIAQKSKEPNDLFYMDIFLGSALLQDQIFFDQDTSLDDCSQSGHLRVEKLFPLTDKEWQFGVRRTLRTFFCSDTGYVQQSTKGS